ncbi:MAG: hypothetical protein ACTHJ3_02785 [Pararhizobium sp.]
MSVDNETSARRGEAGRAEVAMEDDKKVPRTQDQQPVSKRVRRFSIFLILGIVAVVAVGIWFATSWYSARYYSGDNATELPPLPSEQPAPPSSGQ